MDSTAKAIADLKDELAKVKATRERTQTEVDTLTQTVKRLKISADNFAAQIPVLEEKVKHLDNKVIDGLNEL
jgi:septal ring factor EnvC (AmiA/AmiB activator)